MSFYEFILFQNKTITVLSGIVFTMIACLISNNKISWWRPVLFNFTPLLATSFYFVVMLVSDKANFWDVISLWIFEFTILCFFCRLLGKAYQHLSAISGETIDSYIKKIFFLQLCCSIPNLTSSGFGIFSEGSRIAFLSEGSLPKYFLYGGVLLSTLQIGLLARRISSYGRLGKWSLLLILFTIINSILAGSKAGFILWILSVGSLIDYEKAGVKRSTFIISAVALSSMLLVTATVVGHFLGLTVIEFFELSVSRVFLTNDARAISLDLRNFNSGNMSLVIESFRGLASVLGFSPKNPPLGNLLYSQYFASSSESGANSSLSALLTYYTFSGETFFPVIIAITFILVLYVIFHWLRVFAKDPIIAYFVTMFAILGFTLLSQDFMAFQVVFPISLFAIFVIYLRKVRI